MNGHHLIECAKEADRATLAAILVRNGYTVRKIRFKKGKSSSWSYAIEYWSEK